MLKIGIGTGIPYQQGIVGAGGPPTWTPASLPDLELWLANSSLEAIGDAQPIAQWDDESGNARHAVQAGGVNQPTVRLNADGFYEVKGDGVDDWLRSTFGATVAQPTTVWCVGSISAIAKFAFDGIAATPRQWLWRTSAGAGAFTYAAPTQVSSVLFNTSLHYFTAIFSGASSSLRMDGAAIAAGNPGTQGLTGLTLLANITPTAFNAGVLRDVGVCSSVLAGDDLTQLESYLAGLVP